jgi:hypothetical protein
LTSPSVHPTANTSKHTLLCTATLSTREIHALFSEVRHMLRPREVLACTTKTASPDASGIRSESPHVVDDLVTRPALPKRRAASRSCSTVVGGGEAGSRGGEAPSGRSAALGVARACPSSVSDIVLSC